MKVIKRDGTQVEFDKQKIKNAVLGAMNDVDRVNKDLAKEIANEIKKDIKNFEILNIEEIQNRVENLLLKNKEYMVAKSYIKYRGIQEYKRIMKRRNETNRILTQQTRENANKNSDLISTKKGLTLESYISEEMLDYDLPKRIALAHKNNEIKLHDVADRKFGGINCCLFDMKTVIDNNPIINGLEYDNAESIEAYLGVLSDVLLEASAQQYGGFTINEIDHVLEDALEHAYDKSVQYYTEQLGDTVSEEKIKDLALKFVERAFRKRWNGIETRLNSVSNSNTQVPFETIALGNRTTFWARFVTRIILETRLRGCGKNKQTAIFPKIVFFYREEIHGKGGVNEDLYDLAIECRSKRAYPDMLSLDKGYCGYIWKTYGYALAPMGCRAYLSVYFDENGKPVFNGRANCGAVTLNTVRPGILAKGDKDEYFNILKRYFDLATETHLWQYSKMKNVKASSNPLFFCEGGCHIKLEPNETIERAIKTFTWSYGYIGLNEASILMIGKEIHEDNSFAIEVLQKLNEWKDEAIKKHGLLFAIYATPAEGYAETCRNKDFEEFGLIKGITDKKYYMNSFHVNVTAKVDPFEKMRIEKPMFDLSNGGHIFYSEYPINHNLEAISEVTREAMRMGLYEGANFDSVTCKNCGRNVLEYDKNNPHCDKCGSTQLIVVDRVCGYLTYYEIDGGTRVNDGKYQEDQQREIHYGRMIKEGIHDFEILNGDGLRVSVWFKGCPHKCHGCHNQSLWDRDDKFELDIDKIVELCKVRKKLSILGGEAFAPYNVKMLELLLNKVRDEVSNCSIYVWTGYEFEDIKHYDFINKIDKIICGKFDIEKKCDNPMFGSDNQYIIELK